MVSKQLTPSSSSANLGSFVLVCFCCVIILTSFAVGFRGVDVDLPPSSFFFIIRSLTTLLLLLPLSFGLENLSFWPYDSVKKASNELKIDIIVVKLTLRRETTEWFALNLNFISFEIPNPMMKRFPKSGGIYNS